MQKKTLCLALASLFAVPALAQSNVTISGIATVSINNFKLTNTSRPAATENRLDDNTSRFTIKGSEDLGNGLSAYFQIENRVLLDTRPNSSYGNAQGLADGESFVGVRSKSLGSLGFGKFAMHYHEGLGYSETYRAIGTQMWLATGILGFVGSSDLGAGALIAGNTRQQNAIKYDTPVWNGFSGKVIYSFSPFGNEGTLTNTGGFGGCSTQYTNNAAACTLGSALNSATNNSYNKGYAWNVAARYYKAPVNAVVSYYRFKPENGSHLGGMESWKAHADYKFNFGLQVGLGFDRSTVDGLTSDRDRTRNAWMIPVSYSFGSHAVYLTYAKANSVNGISNSGATQYTLAYDYALSKRTFAGVSFTKLKNQTNGNYQPWLANISNLGGSGIVNGEGFRMLSLTLTHFF